MNYIRGAVNAISAPYQYYKDLPPLNPSTLTGAIDVIVIQRPTDNGDTELACSPFHVRFGKWQVLRPGDKKVNVFVNGHPIPFNMKIGEAGEAFFVFETDDDVPDDLITSPLLQPTRPHEASLKDAGVPTDSDNLGVRQSPDGGERDGQDLTAYTKNNVLRKDELDTQEPEFLDLDAPPSRGEEDALANVDTTHRPLAPPPSSKESSQASMSQPGRPAQSLPSPPLTPTHTHPMLDVEQMLVQDKRVDEAIKAANSTFFEPEVKYRHDIVLDPEGYHSHERLDRPASSPQKFSFPSSTTPRSVTPSSAYEMTQSQSQESTHIEGLNVPPTQRAISEPPPDAEEHDGNLLDNQVSSSKLSLLVHTQEYSWEWGAFPQPSPMNPAFGKGGRPKGRGRNMGASDIPAGIIEESQERDHEHGRSHSVPPGVDGSPTKKRKHRELPEDHMRYDDSEQGSDLDEDPRDAGNVDARLLSFGKEGRLGPSPTDPAGFLLSIDGMEMGFELSLMPYVEGMAIVERSISDPQATGEIEKVRGRRNRYGRPGGTQISGKLGDVEASRLFSLGKIDVHRFLDDDSIIDDPRLVVRWSDGQYITRSDRSPVMRALSTWRDTALQQQHDKPAYSPLFPLDSDSRDSEDPSLPPSPSSTDLQEQSHDRQHHARSKSEPPEKPAGKRTSSWAQWWSRGRLVKPSVSDNKDLNDTTKISQVDRERPVLRERASEPVQDGPFMNKAPGEIEALEMEVVKDIPHAESAPALPSTPLQLPLKGAIVSTPNSPEEPMGNRKFAKTLRLTSEQLKALNLKPGSNTITFSLSASGVIACTARIFVWDSSDFVVVSDIDGTITKSDGLGHVFAMIGRDWTHLGVAKLYTDIRRNGYKVMYLTSRAIGQADATRDYLRGIKQNDYQLPEGPVIMSPDRLMASLHREVIMRKPEVFKMACLRDIQRLFGEASRNPFYAGFGNRITDALSYRSVNVPSARIFTIDSLGVVKMELLELAGYKSSYIHMTDLVDQMFPPIHRKWTPEFTDFNYWKVPVQDFPLPDLSPPSPALSARSDTSNQSALARLRNFSLVSRPSTSRLSPSPLAGDLEAGTARLRQMSSFEKLSSTLGFGQTTLTTVGSSRRSMSPTSSMSYESDDEDDLELGTDGRRRRIERRRSMTSMPGTLDEMHFGIDEGEDESRSFENGERDEEEMEDEMSVDDDVGNEAFDEDLLAAGEMKNVPFL